MAMAIGLEPRFFGVVTPAARIAARCESGTVVETTGAGACWALPAACNVGNSLPAFCQSVQPSRQTSESLLTRPSEIHFRMMSPLAGPYWPPVGGRTYQMAVGASAIGSWPSEPPGARVA